MTRRVNGLYQFCAETAVAHSRGCLLPSSAWGWCFEILVGLWRNFSVQKLIPGWWFPAVLAEMFRTVNGCSHTGCGFLGVQLVANGGCYRGRLGMEDG